jgi:hypothetical protein
VPEGRPAPFTVVGSVHGLVVGVWRPVAVRVSNPNPEPIEITGLRVSISGSPNGCDAAANFRTRGSASTFSVPAGAVAYPVPRVSLPQILLVDGPTDQSRCKGQTFNLSFSGEAYS